MKTLISLAIVTVLIGGIALLAENGSPTGLDIGFGPAPEEESAQPTLGTPRSEPAAFPHLAVSDRRQVREVVAHARTAHSGELAELRRVMEASDDTVVLANALRALGRLEPGAPQVYAGLDDERLRLRQEAVRALAGDPSARSRLALERTLESDDAGLRALAMTSLGAHGTDEARARLRQVLASSSSTIEDRAFARSALRTRIP